MQEPIEPWLRTTRIAKQEKEKEKSQLENTKTQIKCKTSIKGARESC